jgi:predicted N-acetyltransferase YhbS
MIVSLCVRVFVYFLFLRTSLVNQMPTFKELGVSFKAGHPDYTLYSTLQFEPLRRHNFFCPLNVNNTETVCFRCDNYVD